MPFLTKSLFLSGLQCHKRLWFEIHQPLEAEEAPLLQHLQGRQFEAVVRGLAPGVLISRDTGLLPAIAETGRLMAKPPALLYQPAFRAGDLAVVVDMLRRRKTQFDLVEVKASTSVSPRHVWDAGFQALVLHRAKVPVTRVFIGLVNTEFTLDSPGVYAGLLAERDVTSEVMDGLVDVADRSTACLGVMARATAPEVPVGPHCDNPHPCPFLDRCHPPVAGYPVQELPRGGQIVAALVAEGYRDLAEVPAARLENPLHRRVQAAVLSGEASFDAAATEELRTLPAPYAYLDFETLSSPVPDVVGTRPFEQVPFQWSVHVEMAPDDVQHHEFLGVGNFGDFDAMAAALVEAVPEEGTIFAYHASFEQTVLLRLARLAPDYAQPLQSMAERLFDLLPVARAAYYHRDMRGSWSIKDVMPTIDSTLAYRLLGEVREGGAAQRAFLALREAALDPAEAAALRADLLAYCAHDTWVLVVLRRYLCAGSPGDPIDSGRR